MTESLQEIETLFLRNEFSNKAILIPGNVPVDIPLYGNNQFQSIETLFEGKETILQILFMEKVDNSSSATLVKCGERRAS